MFQAWRVLNRDQDVHSLVMNLLFLCECPCGGGMRLNERIREERAVTDLITIDLTLSS